jgi:hypothetical protein
MAIRSGNNQPSTPSAFRLRRGKQILRQRRLRDANISNPPANSDSPCSASSTAVIKTRRRNPDWSGWSFKSDIEFNVPVDIDALIDASTDNH